MKRFVMEKIYYTNIVNWFNSLSHMKYLLLLYFTATIVMGIMLLFGCNTLLSILVGGFSQYPAHVIFGRIEFGRWCFSI